MTIIRYARRWRLWEYHKYSSVPILNKEGKYVGTITEGDLLWSLKKWDLLNLKDAEDISILKVQRRMDYLSVSAESNMEDLIERAMEPELCSRGR